MKTSYDKFVKSTKGALKSAARAGLEPVHFGDYLRYHSLAGLTSRATSYGPGKTWDASGCNLWGGPRGMLIGGYGNPNVPYGAGPTRPIDHATYALRVSQHQTDVPLTEGFWKSPTQSFNEVLRFVASITTPEDLEARIKELKKKNGCIKNPFEVMQKKGAKFSRGVPTYVEVMLGNITQDGRQMYGDVALHLVRQLGSGLNYVDYQKEIYGLEGSTKTEDILAEKTPVGATFRSVVNGTREELESVCKRFFDGVDKRRTAPVPETILTVDNV